MEEEEEGIMEMNGGKKRMMEMDGGKERMMEMDKKEERMVEMDGGGGNDGDGWERRRG